MSERADLCNKAPSFGGNQSLRFAEYMLAPKECLVPFDGLDFEVACMADSLAGCMEMVHASDIGLGDEVLVLGLGPIGLMSIPLARMQGAARIYAANRSGGRRMEVARQYGADEVYLTTRQPVGKIHFRKGGVDRALVSAVPQTLPDVMQVMNFGGIISFIGMAPGAQISFDAGGFQSKKLQLRAAYASPALYLPLCLQLLKDGQVDGRALVSHVLPLERIAQAMRLLRDDRENTIKVVITP